MTEERPDTPPDLRGALSLEALRDRMQMWVMQVLINHLDLTEEERRQYSQFFTDLNYIILTTAQQRMALREERERSVRDRIEVALELQRERECEDSEPDEEGPEPE